MILHKALHHRNDVDILFVLRKEGKRGLPSIESSVDELIQPVEDYIESVEED